jgi:hypothetical protein
LRLDIIHNLPLCYPPSALFIRLGLCPRLPLCPRSFARSCKLCLAFSALLLFNRPLALLLCSDARLPCGVVGFDIGFGRESDERGGGEGYEVSDTLPVSSTRDLPANVQSV